MAVGLPTSMVPMQKYEDGARLIHAMFELEDPNGIHQLAAKLKIAAKIPASTRCTSRSVSAAISQSLDLDLRHRESCSRLLAGGLDHERP
jgi:hypothetical protein